jgi:cytoskeletal protein CcmA (bactofilin family)
MTIGLTARVDAESELTDSPSASEIVLERAAQVEFGGGKMAEGAEKPTLVEKLLRPSAGPEPAKESSRPGAGPGTALAPTPAFLGGSAIPTLTPPPRSEGQVATITNSGIEPRTLFVGKGISLSGDINSCDRLVIDGSIQANLQNCKHMTVSETGLFDGNALIDDAEVHGRFEGELTVRNRLAIRATGHVSGSVSYRQIEIEVGGKISGSIQAGRT